MFTELQSLIAARLAAADDFSDPVRIPIYSEAVSDLQGLIDRQFKKLGLVITVLTPRITAAAAKDQIEVTIETTVTENVPINQGPGGSHKSALAASEAVMALLNNWLPADIWTPLEFVSNDAAPLESPYAARSVVHLTRTIVTTT